VSTQFAYVAGAPSKSKAFPFPFSHDGVSPLFHHITLMDNGILHCPPCTSSCEVRLLNENAPPEAIELSRQLCVYMMDHMAQYGYATVTRYPSCTYAGIARNAYGIAGAGSVLVEMKNGISQN
jgi:hypothetical protein